jgi:insecticidal toxin complex protein TccC
MNTAVFSTTPSVVVRDARGFSVREVQYHRHPNTPTATDARVTRHQYDIRGLLSQSADPRLHDLMLGDATVTPNVVYHPSLAGAVLRTDSVDAGNSLALTDAAGRSVLAVSATGTVWTWQYEDASLAGRPLSVTEQAAGQPARIAERFAWADASAAQKGLNLGGQRVRHYDTAGRVQLSSLSISGAILSQSRQWLPDDCEADWQGADESAWGALLSATAYVTRSTADASGAVVTSTDAKGHRQRVAYDVAGQLSGSWLTVNGGAEQAVVTSLTYSAAGQKLREEHGNGVVTTYAYEAETQRLTGISTARPAGHASGAKVLQDLRYEYDPVGNVLKVSNDAEETRFWRNQKVVPENTYTYDSLYQLVSATGREMANAGQQSVILPSASVPLPADGAAYTGYTRTYTYDTGGNLTQVRHGAPATNNNYTTDITVSHRSNRAVLSSLTSDAAQVDALFTAGGQQKQLQSGQQLIWTARDELLKVTPVVREGDANDTECYRYDAGSQRVLKVSTQKTQNSTQTQRAQYLPGLELRTTFRGGTQTESLQVIGVGEAGRAQVRVLHWESGRPPAVVNDQVRYSYDSLIGSGGLEVDGGGNVISQEEYYPYGGTSVLTARSAVEVGYKTLRYSGKERDATGLYYYGYRYYQPWAGRWLSADPAGTVDGLNLFRMVRNNPITLRDDNGLAPTKDDEEINITKIKMLSVEEQISDSSDTKDNVQSVTQREIAFPDELKITLGELTLVDLPVGTILYKSMKYENFDVELAISGQENKEEWEGQYFALDKEISEGYETDYLDENTGNGRAWLHTFEVTKEIPILHNTAEAYGSDNFTGNDKAAAIRNFLINQPDILGDINTKEINHGKPLMPTLTKIGIAFNGPHDLDGGREIITGGELLRNIKITHSESHAYKMWTRV